MDKEPSKWRILFDKYREYIMYAVFGCSTTLISWLTYSLSEAVIGLDLYWSGIVSWIVAVIFAFVTNKVWVFNSKSWEKNLVLKELFTFVGGRLLTGALEVVAVPFFVSIGLNSTLFGVEGLPAKILVSLIIVVFNYILSKFISFNNQNESPHYTKDKQEHMEYDSCNNASSKYK